MTRRYKCERCGYIQRAIFIDEDVPESLICPKCGGVMELLPVKLQNHFHPTKSSSKGRNHEDLSRNKREESATVSQVRSDQETS